MGGQLNWFGFLSRFVLATLMFWCAVDSLRTEDLMRATAYLVLGVLNMIFAVGDIER